MDAPLRIDVRSYVPYGKRNLGNIFGLTKEQIDNYIKKSLHDSCVEIRKYARSHHKYEDRPDRQRDEGFKGLTRAISFHVLDTAIRKSKRAGERYRAEVYIDEKEAPYAKYQVGGIRPHGTKKASNMTFFDYRVRSFKGRYPLVSTKWVRGVKGDDFLGNALVAKRAEVKAIFEANLRRLLNIGG